MADHVQGAWETITQATCVSGGVKQVHCKTCGVLLESQTTPVAGHDIVKVEAKAPTCAETGYNAHERCSKCDYTTQDTIAALPHTPGEPADCVNPQICTVCEAVIENAKGHVTSVTPGYAPTCTKTGRSDIIECLICNQVIQEQIVIPERAHIILDIPETPATCDKKGLSAGQVCAVCEKVLVEQVSIPKAAHTFTDANDDDCNVCSKVRVTRCNHPETSLEVTPSKREFCKNYGITSELKCKKCSTIIEAAEVIPAKQHTVMVVKGYPATLSKPGLTDGRSCALCSLILIEQEIIPVGDPTPPEISISDEDVLGGGTAEEKLLDYHTSISQNYLSSPFKYTFKEVETTKYSYGGASSKTNDTVIVYNKDSWTASIIDNDIKLEMVYFDKTVYAKLEKDGQITKTKCAFTNGDELVKLLGLDFPETGLLAYKKVSVDKGDDQTTFSCVGFNADSDTKISTILAVFNVSGKVTYDDNSFTSTIVIDKDYRILSQNSKTTITVDTEYIDQVECDIASTHTYEYGDYTVSAPSDADAYALKDSFEELFK